MPFALFNQQTSRRAMVLVGLSIAFLAGCATDVTTNYEATALVTYSWQVEYVPNPDKPVRNRRETFASTSLLNRNGERPDDAVTGPDDRGLWWPALPPRPTVDEIEERQRSSDEIVRSPQLKKDVEYRITFESDSGTVTLPTNYSVYRQVVKAYPDQFPLELTLTPNEGFVTKAEPQ